MSLQRISLAAVVAALTLTCSATLIPPFAYVANTTDDTVSIFAIHKSGLRAVGYIYTGPGSNPRSVAVTPSQCFLYVAGDLALAGYVVNNFDGSGVPFPGSPFLTGPELNICVHPGGTFLVAVGGSSITSYAID